MASVITIRVCAPSAISPDVQAIFTSSLVVSSLVVHPGASQRPVGDVIEADLPRESANDLLDALLATGVQDAGTIQVLPVSSWVSRPGLQAEQDAPGDGPDAVVWSQVTQQAYEESDLTWTFLAFMVLATLLAAIAIVTDSTILVIGAMVLGPEFVPIAALGLALVRRRKNLFRQSLRTLVVGFTVSITVTAALALVGRFTGLITMANIAHENRPGTAFIYSPDKWSLIIAVIAGAAGVLAMTSQKAGGMAGVFISVTTIPASGNIALALVFGVWHDVWASALTLVINIAGMALAGWATLAVQQKVWRARPQPLRQH